MGSTGSTAHQNGKRTGQENADQANAEGGSQDRSDAQLGQDAAEQRQKEALEQHRAKPSAQESQVRREQGGHDRPVGGDHVPHPRPEPKPKK
jgi:hypothetical protein